MGGGTECRVLYSFGGRRSGVLLTYEDLGRMLDHSFPACAL